MKKDARFNFGKNWQVYSDKALNQEKFSEAKSSLAELVGEENMKGKTFLDIGCGSGIFALAAKELGAREVVGIDISEESVESAIGNAKKFNVENIDFYKKSILDNDINTIGKFDIVYSWGVLHHTGNMNQAIENALSLVGDGGRFVMAIYNRHWSSPLWHKIKYFYNISPKFIQRTMVYVFAIIIFIAKFLVTRKNPFKKNRGMNFYYDVVDWVGGYPYEYEDIGGIKRMVEKHGFTLLRAVPAKVPTGCNEFVFQKR